MIVSMVIVALLVAGALVLVARPLLGGASGAEDPHVDAERAEIEDAVNRSLDAIEEIEFDYRAGNLAPDDFAEFDRRERARAIGLLRQRDAGEHPPER